MIDIGRWAAMTGIAALVAMGVASGVARTMYPSTFGVRAEQLRAAAWRYLDLHEPFADERREEVRTLEARFADQPVWIGLHAGLGAAFLLAASLQFVPWIRARHLQLHRRNGRVLIALGLIIAATGLYFGVVIPAAGAPEAIIIGVVATLFIASLVNGARAILKKDVVRHREWMIRAFALAVGISTVRIVAAVADGMLTPRGWPLKSVFVLSLAAGWGITVSAAELWIIRTRKTVQ